MSNLDERKELILKSLIDEYIDTAEPVSSATLISKYPLKVSSATIRNEMMELENLGFLEKPYLSSGRVPSMQGYRYYVDQLIKNEQLSLKEVRKIKGKLENTALTLEELTNITTATISELTHYTSIAIQSKDLEDLILKLQFIAISPTTLMIVVVTKNGLIKESIIRFDKELKESTIKDLEDFFVQKLIGQPLYVIQSGMEDYLNTELKDSLDVIKKIVEVLNKIILESDVYIKGATNSLKLPEFSDDKFKQEYIQIIDDVDRFSEIISCCDETCEGQCGGQISIKIAGEEKGLENLSIVTLSPVISGKNIGKISVLAPKRMDYKKVILTMEELLKQIKIQLDDENNNLKGTRKTKDKK